MKKGFTLIELLVAITIVAVLTTVGLTTYQGTQGAARDAVRKNDLNKLATALELYLQKNGKYPTGDENCAIDTANFYAAIDDFIEGQVPKDPKTNSQYCYISTQEGSGFRLFAKLENCNEAPNTFCKDEYNYTVVSDNLLIASVTGFTPPPPSTPSPSPTASPTPSISPSPSPSSSPSSSPTSSPTPSPSPTQTPTPTPSPTPSSTPAIAKKVFVTSTIYRADEIGGLTGADSKCQSLAANLGGTWKAWLSSSTQWPNHPDNIWNKFNGEYRLVTPSTLTVKIADNWTDLTNGDIDNPINRYEDGTLFSGETNVWTNTGSNGVVWSSFDDCSNWSQTSGVSGAGRLNSTMINRWTQYDAFASCSNRYRLYCFEQ